MAAAAKRIGNSRIFWMNGVSDDEQPVVFVPGVDREAKTPFSLGPGCTSTSNRRGTKMRHASASKTQTTQQTGDKKQGHFRSGHSQAYTKEKVSVPTEDRLSPPSRTSLPLTQVTFDASKAKSEVCLKDLCPEDKRRIANLIEELARVSEEKEESVQRLKDEQGNFERKIQQLEQQNLFIAEERETGLQQQYKECQELLGLYQQYLSQQQAKLNQSIAQLSQPLICSKVLSSEEAPSRTSTSRANGSLFDGSYLSLVTTGAQQPNVYRTGDGIRGGVQMLLNPSCDNESCPTEGVVEQGQKRACRKLKSCHRCHDTNCETQQRRSDCCPCLGDGHHYPFNEEECEHTSYRLHSGNVMGSEATAALTRPLLGHEDWEEKRHQLLLQKMQLEMEREKLQARLAEQEERLNRQNQQLRQSRLDYTRFQQASQTEFNSSHSRNGRTEPECPSHQKLPSSVYEAADAQETHPAGQSLHEKHSQTVTSLLDNGSDLLEQSRRDKASAQAKSPVSRNHPTSLPVIQDIPDTRLDFSVAELLDVFSPVTAPEQCKPPAQRPKTSQHKFAFNASKSLSRTLLTPSGPVPQSTQQDPEESQILEDIFFIC